MKKVWCVNVGEYDDNRPVAAFEDEETAEAWAEALSGDVSSFELVATGTAPYKRTLYRVLVYFDNNGVPVSRRDVTELHDWAFLVTQTLWGDLQPDQKISMYFLSSGWRSIPRGGMLEVAGDDKATVVAATSEQIRQWESGEWTPKTGTIDLPNEEEPKP